MSGEPKKGPDRDGEERIALTLTVLRCQAGDESAFERLVNTFAARTHRYLTALLGDDADDVQQLVWLGVYRHIRDLASPGAFRTWLFRLTRNRAIDHLRRRRRERELLTDIDDALEVPAGDLADAEEGIGERGILTAAIDGLPPPQREVVLLRYRDDLSYEEIAQVVGVPLGTVRTRLHHAKRKLTHQLKGETA